MELARYVALDVPEPFSRREKHAAGHQAEPHYKYAYQSDYLSHTIIPIRFPFHEHADYNTLEGSNS